MAGLGSLLPLVVWGADIRRSSCGALAEGTGHPAAYVSPDLGPPCLPAWQAELSFFTSGSRMPGALGPTSAVDYRVFKPRLPPW